MIELTGLTRVYPVGDQEVRALDGVTLRVAKGEHVAIMGPSGSGKSTLLHVLGLLDRPTGGTYRLDGRDVTDLGDEDQAATRRDKIGFVFQFFHLVPRLTAEQNVELPLTLAGVEPGERRVRVRAALEAVGLADRLGHRPDQLSGGQRQRVAVARATVTRPAILLADEPTGNLDRASGREVVQLLEELNGQGLTLLVVTHDPEIGERARRRIRMVDGRVAEDTGAGG
ncbi:MAG: ABC transporter ATP-binding protein [Deferrisomatales bacterium]|nr:ABC transporter ATP-binding protein [Deferrisomatales bacterium]